MVPGSRLERLACLSDSVDGMGKGGSTSRGIQVSVSKGPLFGMSSVTIPSLIYLDIPCVYSSIGTVTHHAVLRISLNDW